MGSETPFSIRVESRNGIARLALGGELDLATAPALNDHLAVTEQDSVRTILLDLRDVTFVDSSGLRVFMQARQRAELNGHRLVIVGANPTTRQVFEITGTTFLLDDAGAVATLEEFARTNGHIGSVGTHAVLDG
jgi:anti-anti-sigma factor